MHNSIFLENVNVDFEQKKILSDISFKVLPNKPVCLIGKGLSGKSTILKSIVGLINISSGDIKISGVSIKTKKILDVYESIGMVFEKDALFDSLKVWENIMFKSLTKKKESELITKSVALLKMVGLSKRDANLFPSELSGGMQKRVALARAIATQPEIIFFDEPTTGLDPIMAQVINDLIRELVVELGVTAVTITHDIQSVRSIADEVSLLHKGVIQWAGPLEKLDKSKNKYLKQFIAGSTVGPIETLR